jgi:filamentous hemagglutinin
VRGLTNLVGGVIASEAAVSSNWLSTGSLRASNLQNAESYRADSYSLGFGFGDAGRDSEGDAEPNPSGRILPGLNLGSINLTPSIPTYLYASGSQASITRSAIAPANIVFNTRLRLPISSSTPAME